MVIIFGIVTLLSAILITSLHTGEQQISLFKDQAQIVAILNRAKSLSISTYGEAGVVPCGYGVHFNKVQNSFFIFKDSAVQWDCSDANHLYDSGEEMQNQTFNLNTSKDVFGDGTNLVDIVFIPPDPRVIINGVSDQGSAIAQLKTASGDRCVSISVNNSGQISTRICN